MNEKLYTTASITSTPKLNKATLDEAVTLLEALLKLRREKEQTLTKEEIDIQIALGTLPYKEWMKIHNIIFKNNWWFFPLSMMRPEDKWCKEHKTITINNIEYYLIADGFINDLYYSLSHNKWSDKKFAKEIIKQCYSCMSLWLTKVSKEYESERMRTLALRWQDRIKIVNYCT